jgi:hypothetical protein
MNTLPEDKHVLGSNLLKEYEGTFIKVKTWGAFERSYIGLNDIQRTTRSVPEFVTNFEGTLGSQPGLARNVRCFLDLPVHSSILTGQCRRVTRPS